MPFTDYKKKSRSERKRNLELLRAIKAGKKLRPWEDRIILWVEGDNETLVFTDTLSNKPGETHTITLSQLKEYEDRMGGTHLLMVRDPGCAPIGSNPDEIIDSRPGVVERIKNTVKDFFHIEQVAAEITDEQKRERWWKRYGNKHQDKEAKVKQAEPEPDKGLDFITVGFEPSPELVEARELVSEINFSTRNYSYGI